MSLTATRVLESPATPQSLILNPTAFFVGVRKSQPGLAFVAG